MRSVRCDVCGTKALLAASQCPNCGHLLNVRDGFGELLPLAHCPTCDSDYPAREGNCRWCGTKPESIRVGPLVWRAAGILALVTLVVAGWLAHRSTSNQPAAFRGDTSSSSEATTPVDSVISRRSIPAAQDSGESLADSVGGAVALVEAAPPMAGEMAPFGIAGEPQADAMPSAPAVSARRAPSPVATATPRRTTRWVGTVARRWFIVRASASPGGRIVASIGPDTRVQLGEVRDGWVRVRTRGIVGWAERRAF